MGTQTEPVIEIRDWCIDRIHYLTQSESEEDHLNALAIAEEYDEWINLDSEHQDIEYLCLEEELD